MAIKFKKWTLHGFMFKKGEAMANVIIVCGVFSGVVISIYLLNIGKLGSGAFVTLVAILFLSGLALHGFDRLKELDIKNLRLILAEAKDIRKDIYAKVETVKKIGEKTAELAAFSVARVGRFASPDLQKEMIQGREQIREILEEIDSKEDDIDRILSQIDNMVLRDLKGKVLQEVRKNMGMVAQFRENPTLDRTFYNRAKEILFDRYNRGDLEQHLRGQNLSLETIGPLLDKVDKFIRDKNF